MRLLALAALLLWADPAFAQTAGRPWIGVGVEGRPGGVGVTRIMEGTPAETAGLQTGDVILSIDATAVSTPEALIAHVIQRGVGSTVNLAVDRAGKRLELSLKLVVRPDELELIRKQLTGKPAPALVAAARAGDGETDLAKLKGHVVLLDFWATWCGACASSHPTIGSWIEKYGPRGLRVVGVASGSDKLEAVSAYVKKRALPFPSAHDADSKIAADYHVGSIPTFVVVDGGGVVRYVGVGAGDALAEVEAALVKHLPPEPAAAPPGNKKKSRKSAER